MDGAFYQFQATVTGDGVAISTPNSLPASNGSVATTNTDGTFGGWLVGIAVPGSGTELLRRASASTVDVVTGSSFAGGVVTLPELDVTERSIFHSYLAGDSGTGHLALYGDGEASTSGGVIILDTGHFLIGTTTLNSKLTVWGGAYFAAGAVNEGATYIDQSGTAGASRLHQYDGAGVPKNLLSAAGDSYIQGGNFGVGIGIPFRPLHIKDSGGSYVARFESTSANSYLEFLDTTANASHSSIFGNYSGDLFFQKVGASYGIDFITGSTSKLKILNSGNIIAAAGISTGPITFAVLNATTATAALGVYRITDRGNRFAYPDGTNWRFVGGDAIIS